MLNCIHHITYVRRSFIDDEDDSRGISIIDILSASASDSISTGSIGHKKLDGSKNTINSSTNIATAAEININSLSPPYQEILVHQYKTDEYQYTPNSATECMLKLEQKYTPLIYEYNLADKPMLHSVKIVNNIFYVLLNMFDLQPHVMKKWRNGSFRCNGVPGGKEVNHFKMGKKDRNGNLIIECPASVDASKDILKTFSVEEATYETELFDECERKDIEHFSPPNRQGSGSGSDSEVKISIGMTATVKGNRTKALEWAAYHHIIGVDHIWIYINEDWNNATDIVHRDYITWIPYNFNIQYTHEYNKARAFTPHEVFRIASQNDALWRAKRMGLEWIVPIDFDEYVEITPPTPTMHEGLSAHVSPSHTDNDIDADMNTTFPNFIKSIKNAMGDEYVGMQMKSLPFGGNIQDQKQKGTAGKETELTMDNVWHEKGVLDSKVNRRYKLILNVTDTTSIYNLHYLGGTSTGKSLLYSFLAREIRVNHYKQPDKGVFNNKEGGFFQRADDIESYTSFKEKYRTKLLDELHHHSTLTATKRNLTS